MLIDYVEFLTQDFSHPVLSRKHDKGDYYFDIICRIKCEKYIDDDSKTHNCIKWK